MNRRFLLLVSTLVLVVVTYILGWSSLFTVSSIEVNGSSIQLDTGVTKGQKLARVEPRAIAAKFENLDWVSNVQVSRNWINGKVTINITERTPIAIYNNTFIDSTGKSFAPHGNLSKTLVQIQASDLSAAIKAVTFFTALPTEIKATLTVVKIQNTGALVLEVTEGGKRLEILWGNDGDNELKLKVFKALIALPENTGIKRVDVSAPHAPIVE
jgi:cell division septal protein FtsQ